MKLMKTVKHPNIIQVEDYFIDKKCCGTKK